MANVSELVVEATRKDLLVTVVDEYGNPVNITGGTVKLQGQSEDLPGVDIDEDGTLFDAPNGVAKWADAGSLVTKAQLTPKAEATFTLRVKFTDAAGKVDWGPAFALKWVKQPLD